MFHSIFLLNWKSIKMLVEWGKVQPVIFVIVLTVAFTVEGKKQKETGEKTRVKQGQRVWITGNATKYTTLDVASSVKIGSFNLKQFGEKKSKNETLLNIISKIITRYDLIALQEITDVKENAMKRLMEYVTSVTTSTYAHIVSERVGDSKQKEQYGIVFRSDLFQIKRSIIFNDTTLGDPFRREPQVAEVVIKENNQKFVVINMHVAPKHAVKEIDSLTDVLTWVEDNWKLRDIVILGDLNADCNYIRKKDVPNIRLLNNPKKYKWLISNYSDTTVGKTDCAYDRIIITGSNLTKNVIPKSPAVFEFDVAYKLDHELAYNVSDHYPVEFSINIEKNIEQIESGGISFIQTNVLLFIATILVGFGLAVVIYSIFSRD